MYTHSQTISMVRSDRLRVRWIRKAVIWGSFFGMLTTPVHAQSAIACPDMGDDRPMNRHEIGLNMIGLVHFAYNSLYSRPKDPRVGILNGFSYKRRTGLNAYRVSLDMFRDDFEVGWSSTARHGYSSAIGSGLRTELRLGFERQFTSGRIRPLAAVDIVGRREHVRFSGDGTSGLYGPLEPMSHGYNITSMRYGPALSIGLAYSISKRFSCSMESSVLFVLYYQDDSDLDIMRSCRLPLDSGHS